MKAMKARIRGIAKTYLSGFSFFVSRAFLTAASSSIGARRGTNPSYKLVTGRRRDCIGLDVDRTSGYFRMTKFGSEQRFSFLVSLCASLRFSPANFFFVSLSSAKRKQK